MFGASIFEVMRVGTRIGVGSALVAARPSGTLDGRFKLFRMILKRHVMLFACRRGG